MKQASLLATLGVWVMLWSCGSPAEQQQGDSPTQKLALAKGKKLMEEQCYSCHNPDAAHDSRLAPPMYGVRKHYMEGTESQEAFVSRMIAYIENPSEDQSLMPHALERFGLMPALKLPEADAKAIAAYIYQADFRKPGKGHGHGKGHADTDYMEQGKSLALKTKATLGKNLMGALQKGGPLHALSFCNTRAYPLTDSMSQVLDAHIRRVSDQPRNPDNAANETEIAHINRFKQALAQGEQPKPILEEVEGKMTGYYPIMTNGMCLQCHGTPGKELEHPTLQQIKKLYPEDQATGYSANQVRGMWVVEMKKS